jgi:hypothetical protein
MASVRITSGTILCLMVLAGGSAGAGEIVIGTSPTGVVSETPAETAIDQARSYSEKPKNNGNGAGIIVVAPEGTASSGTKPDSGNVVIIEREQAKGSNKSSEIIIDVPGGSVAAGNPAEASIDRARSLSAKPGKGTKDGARDGKTVVVVAPGTSAQTGTQASNDEALAISRERARTNAGLDRDNKGTVVILTPQSGVQDSLQQQNNNALEVSRARARDYVNRSQEGEGSGVMVLVPGTPGGSDHLNEDTARARAWVGDGTACNTSVGTIDGTTVTTIGGTGAAVTTNCR